MRTSSTLRRLAPIALVWLGLVACADSSEEAIPARSLVWIVVDSLRADHLGAYGYSRDTSPAIDALARQGALFERAYATAPWTMPSVASLLTGLPPSTHQVTDPTRLVPESLHTLPEILREEGFETAAVVSHEFVGTAHRFQQGFDVFHEEDAQGHEYLSTPTVTDRAVQLLEGYAERRVRFFLFVHYFDPHYRYRPHSSYGFAARRAGSLEGKETIFELRQRLDRLTEEEIAFLVGRYDEEIRFTDGGIGRLIGSLETLGLDSQTLVVFTADHGEELLDRGWLGHTRSLYEELLRVPLVLRGPGIEPGRRIEAPVSLVSLAPTSLDLLRVAHEAAAFHAGSFAGLARGAGAAESPPLFAEVDMIDQALVARPDEDAQIIWGRYKAVGGAGGRPLRFYDLQEDPEARDDLVARLPEVTPEFVRETLREVRRQAHDTHMKAVVSGRHKLIRNDANGRVELYDLVADPDERTDLAPTHSGLAQRLEAVLDTQLAAAASRAPAADDRDVTPEEIERLRALGYVGGPGAATAAPGAPR